MKIRAELHLDQNPKQVILVPKIEEKPSHLALKLAAFAMFFHLNPIVEPSTDHPSLLGVDVRPDLICCNEAGELDIWIECGTVSMRKLDKLTRRFPRTRIVVLKEIEREALRLRRDSEAEIRHQKRIEIWYWPEGEFNRWLNALEEKTEIFGEANEKSFNLVVNQTAYAVDLMSV